MEIRKQKGKQVGRLTVTEQIDMHGFSCTDAADMYYGTLADRVRFFKESKK